MITQNSSNTNSENFKFISDNYKAILENVRKSAKKSGRTADDIRIMAVVKTIDAVRINAAVNAGITLIGENRVQEFISKKQEYPNDIEIHFIGSLQTNKVKNIINDICVIQSVDNLRLASEIDRLSVNNNAINDILIQINIGKEETKSGISPENLEEFAYQILEFKGIRLRGLMAIPPKNGGARYFEDMQRLFEELRSRYNNNIIDTLSMGMSNDYELAIEYGSTIVRIGSALFGERC